MAKGIMTAFWKIFFLMAGLFNCLVAGLGMCFPAVTFTVVTGVNNTEPVVLYIFFIACCVVFLFGLGYFSVVINVVTSRGIILIGALGKICFFSMGLYGYLHGIASLIFMITVCIDLIWAVFFIIYLRSTHRTICELLFDPKL